MSSWRQSAEVAKHRPQTLWLGMRLTCWLLKSQVLESPWVVSWHACRRPLLLTSSPAQGMGVPRLSVPSTLGQGSWSFSSMRLRPARRWTVGSLGQRVLSYVWLWNLDHLGFWKAKNITENCILWNCGWYVGPLSPPEILMGKTLCGGMFRVNYVTVHWIFNSLMCVQLEIWKLWKSQSMVPTKKLVLGTVASCGREALRNPFRRSQFFHSPIKGSCSVGHQDPCWASLSVQCGNHQTAWQEIT